MITLVNDEKDFLKSIVDLSKRTNNMFFGNLVEKYLINIDVQIIDKDNIEYRFDEEYFLKSHDLRDVVHNISWTFMRFIKLLKYLEENNYLYLYQETESPIELRFGQLIRNNAFIVYQIHDPEIKNLLFNYSFKTIVIGQTLIDYVSNGFKTEEQLRHEANLKIAEKNLTIANASLKAAEISVKRATYAIIVSIILGIISIGSSFYISNKQSKCETKMDKTQFNSLNNGIVSIDSILTINSKHDTINAKIIKEIRIKK
jgi:hypothetical protein